MTVTSLDAAGAAEITSADHCIGSPLAAGATCQVVLPADTDGRSTVVADTGKIRAAIEVFGPSPFPLVTAVAARPQTPGSYVSRRVFTPLPFHQLAGKANWGSPVMLSTT